MKKYAKEIFIGLVLLALAYIAQRSAKTIAAHTAEIKTLHNKIADVAKDSMQRDAHIISLKLDAYTSNIGTNYVR